MKHEEVAEFVEKFLEAKDGRMLMLIQAPVIEELHEKWPGHFHETEPFKGARIFSWPTAIGLITIVEVPGPPGGDKDAWGRS
jgi:hypothetical protein